MAEKGAQSATGQNSTARFGTFAGVFVPNILTILGIILFLRMGEIAGNAGLWQGLAIVAIANMISLLTGLSLSAIATNMTVRAGGNYYVISRSLGLEVGGAIGIPLFLSQAISVAFYIIGFTESLIALETFVNVNPQVIATVVTLVFVVIAYVGADFALRIQYFILAVLVASLVSFFVGAIGNLGQVTPNIEANFEIGNSFWVMFALFFPAVTGIEVGTSLSGDLKDPSRSIPVGTIASIVFTAIIYLLVVVLFVYAVPLDALLNDNLSMQSVALVPELILAGVWASTLSSALGSVLAAPRTLQAIARDRVVPQILSSQMGSKTEPRAAVLLTGVIAVIVIWAGDLNAVAPVIAMFFLNTYGMVNLTAGIENLVGNPSFRPRFRIPWYVSILGALGCYAVMLLINPIATLVAIIISYGVFFYLQKRNIERTWGDVRSGLWFAVARWALFNLQGIEWSAKNWRPNIVVFTGQPHNRQQLVQLAKWLSLGQGIVTFVQLIVGNTHELAGKGVRDTAKKGIIQFIQKNHMKAFAEAEIVPNFSDGALALVQSHGIGGIIPNSVLMGWSRTHEGRVTQLRLMDDFVRLKKSVLFLAHNDEQDFGQKKQINIWWQGGGGNEDLMLLLAYFISQHHNWRGTMVQLLRVIDSPEGINSTSQHLEQLLDRVRVDATPKIIVREKGEALTDIIQRESTTADLTIIGMRVPKEDEAEDYAKRLEMLIEAIGSVLLVRNAQTEVDILTTE